MTTSTSTSTTTTSRCPECGGARFVRDPLGMRFDHGPSCVLRMREDSRLVADVDRGSRTGRFTRPPTATEVALLAACGITLPSDATVVVQSDARALRARGFTRTDTSGMTLLLDVETGAWRPA